MDTETVSQILKSLAHTEVTKTVHHDTYPALSPSRPELSQAGKVILITGGSSGIGFSIARAFVRAAAHTVIILGRRADVLKTATASLEQESKTAGTSTKVISRACDVANLAEIEALWKDLGVQGVVVDVFVANVAKFTEPKPMMELGADEVWSQMEVNAKSPLYFFEQFYAQGVEKQKFLVNVTSAVIHMTAHSIVAQRPAYILSKMAGALLFQLMALHVPADKVQITTFHPGTVHGSGWDAMGIPPSDEFDSDELPGAWAVWAASKEAAFLHGRFTWASWDIEELSTGEIRKRIESDPEYLRATILGANGGL